MPSTTPDFNTVTAGCSAGALPGSVKVEGERSGGLRRGGGTSPGFARSGFGQASSKDGGGASGTGGGAADGLGRTSADSRSGVSGSLVRDCARSRSLRDVDEN